MGQCKVYGPIEMCIAVYVYSADIKKNHLLSLNTQGSILSQIWHLSFKATFLQSGEDILGWPAVSFQQS